MNTDSLYAQSSVHGQLYAEEVWGITCMKRFTFMFIFVIISTSLFFSGCKENNVELVWVIPESYAIGEDAKNGLNFRLNELGVDYTVRFIEVPNDGETTYTERILQMIEDGEKMDIIYSNSPNSFSLEKFNSAYYRFIQLGIFSPIDEYFSTEIGQKLYNIMPEKHWEALRVNNQIYGINGSLSTLSTDNVLYVNSANGNVDFGNKTVSNFTDFSTSFLNSDFNEDVEPIWFFPQYLSYYYFCNCLQITDCLYVNSSNEVIFALDDEKYLDYLYECKQLQDKKILINGQIEDKSNYYASFEDILGGYALADSFNNYAQSENYYIIPCESDNYVRFSNIATGIYSGSSNKKAAFELLALTQTDEDLNNLLVFGVNGIDYKLNGDIPTYTNRHEYLRVFPFGNRFICYPMLFETAYKSKDYIIAYEMADVPDCLGFVFDDTEYKECIVTTNLLMDELQNVIMSDEIECKDISEIISAYKNEMINSGIYSIADEISRQYSIYQKSR